MPFGIEKGEGVEGIRVCCVEDSVLFQVFYVRLQACEFKKAKGIEQALHTPG